jgi:hypothetical protein
MTIQQLQIFEKYKQEYDQRYKAYSYLISASNCGYFAYKSVNDSNNDIFIRSTTISGLSDSFEPFFDIIYMLIEPNGNVIILNTLYNQEQIDNIFTQFTKI